MSATSASKGRAATKAKAPKAAKGKPTKAAPKLTLLEGKPDAKPAPTPPTTEPEIHCSHDAVAPLANLKPNPRNPNKHPDAQLQLLAKVIVKAGWRSPIVVSNRSGLITKGHGRFEAAKIAGLKVAPVDFQDYASEADELADMIADNRLAELAEIDLPEVKELLESLALGGFDLDLTGYSEDELADLMLAINPADAIDAEPQIDRAEVLNEKWKVALGDVWTVGKHRLACGDATDEATVAKLLGDVVPGMMVTDPPYGVNYKPERRSKNALRMGKVINDDVSDWTDAWDLFKGDVAYVYHSSLHGQIVSQGLSNAGFAMRNTIIWAKSRLVLGQGDYHWQHEPCWYAVREGKPSLRNDDRTQTTLWEIEQTTKQDGLGHSTQKPLECMLRPIRNHLIADVYEPFLGSGTTMVACENLARRCFGIEIRPAYCAVVLQRMADAFPQLTIERAT